LGLKNCRNNFLFEKLSLSLYRYKKNNYSMNIKKFNEMSTGYDLTNDFPYQEKLQFATIYSKEPKSLPICDMEISSDEELEDYNKLELIAGTRIGILNEKMHAGEEEISEVIVIEEDTYYYSQDDMTTDGIAVFELEDDMGYVPAQEPQDVLEVGNPGCIENFKQIKKSAKLYGLELEKI
jgi:hypothetical protein